MLSPEHPTDIDANGTGLDYWLNRACNGKGSLKTEFHLIHRGARLTVHPQRIALIEKNNKQIRVQGRTGRGWCPEFVRSVTAAIDRLDTGGGREIARTLGHVVREEIARRATGSQRAVADRVYWCEWLEDDELPLLLGSWLFRSQIMSLSTHIQRNASITFHPTNSEFKMGTDVADPSLMLTALHRLAILRGAPTKADEMPTPDPSPATHPGVRTLGLRTPRG